MMTLNSQGQNTLRPFNPPSKADSLQASCKSRMAKAQKYLRGYQHPYDPAKAFALFMECANQGVPKAMNAIGNMYFNGQGVDKSCLNAIAWYEKAAQAGYLQSWVNLGIVYKTGGDIDQDFKKAYSFFQKASELGLSDGTYYLGLMHYFGLGCAQDYNRAFELFSSTKEDNLASMYMLGLCYRNGYGTARDTAEGNTMLRKAVSYGYTHALGELSKPIPENPIKTNSLKSVSNAKTETKTPTTFKRVKHNAKADEIAGTYTGYMVMYDWSGQYPVKQSLIKAELSVQNNIITGRWTESDTLSTDIEAKITDTTLCFTKGQYKHWDHYYQTHSMTWQFKNAELELVKNDTNVFLAGNVRFYAQDIGIPYKPVYISLTKANEKLETPFCKCGKNCKCGHTSDKSAQIAVDYKAQIDNLIVFPNPFSNELNITFSLKNSGNVKVSLISLDGRPVHEVIYKSLSEGEHTKLLQAEMPAGVYIINVSSGNKALNSVIVKR